MEVSDKPVEENVFQKTDLIQFLEKDNSLYRIADLAQRETPNEFAYYEIENVNGYHSAKLRVYQDIMDVANLPQAQGSTSLVFNPFLWNIMNVKYIIAQGRLWEGIQPIFQAQSGELIYYNPSMLPRAFFVDTTIVEESLNILYHLRDGDFNAATTAYFEEALPQKIDPADSLANAIVIEHKNEYIKIEANATGNNLLFISEIYYPSWKAYVDGNETEIFKTNYAFRSIIVPKGKHTIELKFESEGFQTGKTLSLASNILVALLLVLGIFIETKKKKVKKETVES